MKVTKKQLRRIIKEAATREDIREWFLSKEKENRLDKVLAGMKASDEEREKIMSALAGEDGGKEEKSESIRITKRQLRRIIKEEKAKVLAAQKIRRTVRRRLMEQAGGETLVIDYRSPPSGLGTLENSGIVIQYPDSQPQLKPDIMTDWWEGDLESKADYAAMANWLRSAHGVTHVRDSELMYEVDPDAGDRFTLDKWLDVIGAFFP